MTILYSKNFVKEYSKLRMQDKAHFDEGLRIFMINPFEYVLHNHALHGEYAGLRSIRITGDLRALFVEINTNTVEFLMIDSHSNLYS